MTTETNERLRDVVNEMDGMAQAGFSEIAAIARLALAAMEAPRTCSDLDTFARAFTAIEDKAKDIENLINATAEAVACNYVDDGQRHRRDARRQWRPGVDAAHGPHERRTNGEMERPIDGDDSCAGLTLATQLAGESSRRDLRHLSGKCEERFAGEVDYAKSEAQFVHQVEQVALLLSTMGDCLDAPSLGGLKRGRRLLELAREHLERAVAEAEEREAPGCSEDSSVHAAAAFTAFCEASGAFLGQTRELSAMLRAMDRHLACAQNEQSGDEALVLVRRAVSLSERAVVEADEARHRLCARLH